jgi:hypothetical protein
MKHLHAALVFCCVWAATVQPSLADGVSTECTANAICYCVQNDLKSVIAGRVDEIRARIAEQRRQGKAIGYLSTPISTVAGSYLGVNAKVATSLKERVEERFGVRAAWVLNTAAREFVLPGSAKGGDYMLMWTRVLEGDQGFGPDFDFVYFVGPTDFGRFFGFDGHADMEKLERYYDGLSKTDAALPSAVTREEFRNYYGLRASVSYSAGSHDEWNIIRKINDRRRSKEGVAAKFGLPKQIAVLFDGTGVAPGLFNAATAEGNEGACP